MTIKLIILAAMYCIAVLGPRLAKQQAQPLIAIAEVRRHGATRRQFPASVHPTRLQAEDQGGSRAERRCP
jgi:hypothetical protein